MRTLLGSAPAVTAAVLLSLVGCAPVTQYRYTALVPPVRPLAWDGRTAKDGSLRLEGTIATGGIRENLAPQLHDTAVLVPDTTVGGVATLALTKGFELGVRGSYASYAWSEPSAVGTEPLPSRPSVWGVGPELRGTIPVDRQKRFAIGLAANYMRYEVPFAEWSLTGPSSPNGQSLECTPSPTCTVDAPGLGTGLAHYSLFDERSEAHWALNFGVYPSYAFGQDGEYGHVVGVIGAHTGYKNDGFTNSAQNGSTLSADGLVWLFGAGYGIDVDVAHLAALIYQPVTDAGSSVNYGPGFLFTAGVNLELWESKDELKAEREEQRRKEYAVPPPANAPVAPPPAAQPAPGANAPPPAQAPQQVQPGVYIMPAPR